jgi:general secretion pathway protein D
MTGIFSRARFLPWIAISVLFLADLSLFAQGTRPGSAPRGTTTTGRTPVGRSTTGIGGTSRTTNGQRQYRSNTELGDATIEIDPETRSLIMVTDEDTHLELMKVIKTLDQPKPQVLIKVVFLEVTYNTDSDIGVEGTYTFDLRNNPVGATTGTQNRTTTTNTNVPNGTSQLVTSTSQDIGTPAKLATTLASATDFGLKNLTSGFTVRAISDDWSATLRAIATKGKVEVLSRPSIMARNNQEAVIVVGQEVPFVTNTQITDNGQTINTVQYDNVGIILRVTPFITSEGTVEMIVAPEISNLTDQTIQISTGVSNPIIAKRSAETVVVTPNAQTVVIGGLMETQRTSSVQKVPILGDIPVIGFPFRRTIKTDVKKELMIFLTPFIVNDRAAGKRVTADELNRTELVDQAFTPADFDKYLDDPLLFPTKDLPQEPTVRRATAVKTTTTVTKSSTTSAPAKPAKSKSLKK